MNAMPQPSRSFADREIARQGHLVHKLKARDSTGRWAYYFVLVKPHLEVRFMAAIGGDGTVDLEEYGRVVGSCYGEEPSAALRIEMKERFGFDV